MGASGFPRHWVYGDDGRLEAKSGLTDLKNWLGHRLRHQARHGATPTRRRWSPRSRPSSSAELSTELMQGGAKPEVRSSTPARALVRRASPATELFVLLDGVVAIEVDGDPVAEIGPGAVSANGPRSRAACAPRPSVPSRPCRVAVAAADQIDRVRLAELAEGHRREDQPV